LAMRSDWEVTKPATASKSTESCTTGPTRMTRTKVANGLIIMRIEDPALAIETAPALNVHQDRPDQCEVVSLAPKHEFVQIRAFAQNSSRAKIVQTTA
jgi:hypothetical protein